MPELEEQELHDEERHFCGVMLESALASEYLIPGEDEAWAYLQPVEQQ